MKNKLILLSSYISGHVVMAQLIENLENQGIPTINIDIFSAKRRKSNGLVEDIHSGPLLNILYKIPRLRAYVRSYYGRLFIKEQINAGDIVVIHFMDPGYLKYIDLLSQKTDKIIVHWWGSDLYRSSEETKKKISHALDKCYRVVLVKGMLNYFLKYFPSHAGKINTARLGLGFIDVIDKKKEKFSKDDVKLRLGIPECKIIITCAYNGSEGQQHLKIIDALAKLPNGIKDDICLLFPMTYGGNENYHAEVNLQLSKAGIKYKIIRNYLAEEDLAELRLLSDIVVNIQITDGFSASVQESLFSGNVLIVGDWLPYAELEQWGIHYIKTSLINLHDVIKNTIEDIEYHKNQSSKNPDIIKRNSSWSAVMKDIINAYDCGGLIEQGKRGDINAA